MGADSNPSLQTKDESTLQDVAKAGFDDNEPDDSEQAPMGRAGGVHNVFVC